MKKLIFIALCACCLASCRKFLEEYSTTDIVPKTARHFGEILFSDGYPKEYTLMQPYIRFMDDDVECYASPALPDPSVAASAAPVFQWQSDFILQSTTAGYNTNFNSWALYYKLLLGANVAIQYLDQSEGLQQDKDQYKGEAYALRAYYHLMLVNFYARPYNDSTTTPDKSLGVPIRTDADLSDVLLPRNSVKDVYTRITSDVDSAVLLLSKEKKTSDNTRISFVAAHLLASRVYLYMENWEAAVAHADKVIQYHPQLMDLNTWNGYPEPETKPLIGTLNVETIWCYGSGNESRQTPMGEAYDLSHDLVNTFENNDLRKFTWMFENPPFLKPFLAPDFQQAKYSTGNATVRTNNSWRSAEAYLNRAEAYIQLYKKNGDQQAAVQALNSLNTLRAARFDKATFTPWTVQPADVMLEMCREERRRELFVEEAHRWFDLRRYGMPVIRHIYRPNELTQQVYQLNAKDPLYILPIPKEVTDRNPALQPNPNYQGIRQPQ